MAFDPHDTTIPLASRVGTQLFQLRPSIDAFSDEIDTPAPLGHILFDAASRTLCIDDQAVPDANISWNDVVNSVCWVSPNASLRAGRLCFAGDLREAIGTVTDRNGESSVVTGSAMLPRPGDAPPAYTTAMMATMTPAAEIANSFTMKSVSPFMMLAAGASAVPDNTEKEITSNVYVTEFKTERRLQGDEDEDSWTPWHSLEWGIEKNVAGTPIVCYVNDVDVSSSTTIDHGVTDATVLVKMDGNAENKDLDYRFRITLNHATSEADQKFLGTFEKNNKVYEWRGTYRKSGSRSRTVTTGPKVGPGGRVITQLMSITSLKSTTKEVKVEVQKPDGSTGTEMKIMTEDMAQDEGDRIFARIILHSAPDDVKKLIDPDMKPLDGDEEKIAKLGPKYLEPAAIVNVMSFLKNADAVSAEQRQRINEDKCKAFTRACATFGPQDPGAKDFVTEWGWNRQSPKDMEAVDEIQLQYRAVTQACYRLGYRRAVLEFQPFLQDAKYWYNDFADHLCSDLHIRELTARVKAGDVKITHDIYDWQTKLQILEEYANIEEKEQRIKKVISDLHGAATFATLDGVAWSSEHASNILKFFEDMDEVEKDTKMGKQSKLAMLSKTEEYIKLQKYLDEREHLTYGELGKQLVEALSKHAESLKRAAPSVPAKLLDEVGGHEMVEMERQPSIAELATAVRGDPPPAGQPPSTWAKCKPYFRWAARAAVVAAGIYFLQKSIREGFGKLDLQEQVSMFATLFEASRQIKELVGQPLAWLAKGAATLARGVGSCIADMLPARALAFLEAAKNWVVNLVQKLGDKLSTVGAKLGEKVPGFLSSAATKTKGFLARNWSNIAKGVGMVFGAAVSIWAVVAGVYEFKKAWAQGRTIDIIFSGAQLFFTAMGTLAFALQIIGTLAGSAKLIAFAGTLGIWAAGIGLAIAVIALIVTLLQPHPDPVKEIIDKYGAKYKLLKS